MTRRGQSADALDLPSMPLPPELPPDGDQTDGRPGVDPTSGSVAPVPGRSSPSIHQALAAVMREVDAVGKGGFNKEQQYNYRGVDHVINAIGPAMRKHGVVGPLPELLELQLRDVRTSRDKPAREVTLKARYTFVGPAGDTLAVVVPGESMDVGDKGSAKAMSVAYRIALLQTFCIPTDEPDPDSDENTYERGHNPPPGQLLPQDVIDARDAVRGSWAAHYGGTFNQTECADLFARWSGGEVLTQTSAARLRAFSAYLDGLPRSDAGGDPAGSPTGPEDVDAGPRMATKGQVQHVIIALKGAGVAGDREQRVWIGEVIGRDVESRNDLTADEYQQVKLRLAELANSGDGPP